MKWLSPLALAAAFAGIVYTEVLDLGDVKQFDPKIPALPDGLQPDAIWINPADGESGFSIVLGKDLKAKVDGVLEGCGKVDNQCYQEVIKVLQDGTIQMDKRLDSRQLIVAAATIAEVVQDIREIVEIVGMITVVYKVIVNALGNEKGNHVPVVFASAAAKLPQATPITISAGGSAVITITQSPTPTLALQGSVTPEVTVVASASNGFAKGDVVAVLDKDLASRLDEFMQRAKDCSAGIDLDRKNPSARKLRRAGGTPGQAFCAAREVVTNMRREGPFNNLLLYRPASVHIQLAQLSEPLRVAFNEFLAFVVAYRPMLNLAAELDSEQLATYIMALTIDAVIDQVRLGEQNKIKATPSDDTSTDKPSGCPDKKSLVCGIPGNEVCAMKISGSGNTAKAVCKDGPKKDCECVSPPLGFTYIPTPARQKLLDVLRRARVITSGPQCPIVVTAIPGDIFSSAQTNIYSHFCSGWVKGAKYSMTVNATGANVLPEPHKKSMVTKRTPPANAGSYQDFRFDLSFEPAANGGACTKDCNAAFSQFSSACAASSPGVFMYEKGTYDVGCGTFSYNIHKAAAGEPRLGDEVVDLIPYPRKCHTASDMPALKGDVHDSDVRGGTIFACVGGALVGNDIRKDNKTSFVQSIQMRNSVPYQYNVWWKEGCRIEKNGGPTALSREDPLLQGKGPSSLTCSDMLWSNWKECGNNGGRGGAIQMGCLMYEFVASDVPRKF